MARRLATATLAAVLLSGPTAEAHAPDRLAESEAIARAAFPSACEPVEFVMEHGTHHEYPDAVMWVWGPGWSCKVFHNATAHNYGPARFCTFLVHEYGHLAGLDHSDDPSSPMNTQPPIWPACAALEPAITIMKNRRVKIHAKKKRKKRRNHAKSNGDRSSRVHRIASL